VNGIALVGQTALLGRRGPTPSRKNAYIKHHAADRRDSGVQVPEKQIPPRVRRARGAAVTEHPLRDKTVPRLGVRRTTASTREHAQYFAHGRRRPYQIESFGGTRGGPIVRTRRSFGDYQADCASDQGRTQRSALPTALMRQGNFSEVGKQIYTRSLHGVRPETHSVELINPISPGGGKFYPIAQTAMSRQ